MRPMEADGVAQAGRVGQDAHDAPIVGLKKLLQDQTGEQLGLGEDLRAEAMGIQRQGGLDLGPLVPDPFFFPVFFPEGR